MMPTHLYVTPLDERTSTLCLFLRGPWLEDSSSLVPLALASDLYTVAMVLTEGDGRGGSLFLSRGC